LSDSDAVARAVLRTAAAETEPPARSATCPKVELPA
jgi:hypothetical protein